MIVLYLGSVSTLAAAIACVVLPRGFVVLTELKQYSYLIGAGWLFYEQQGCRHCSTVAQATAII